MTRDLELAVEKTVDGKRVEVEPRVREASFSDYDQMAAVMARNGLRPRARHAWAGLWKGNPAFEEKGGKWPIGWVLEAEGQIVGCLANVPRNYLFRGELVRAAAECDWAVDRLHRGYALALWQRHTRQTGVQLLLTTTVSAASEPTYSAFRWSRAPVGQWDRAGYWVAGYTGFLRSALTRKSVPLAGWLQYPLSAVLFCGDQFVRVSRPLVKPEIEWLPDFDCRFDAFWEELKFEKNQVLLAVRDRATLAWHFRPGHARQNPWIAVAAKGSRLAAYAVFIRRDHPRSGLKRVRLVDFQSLEDDKEIAKAILTRTLARCREEGVHMLEDIGCLADRLGLRAPYHRRLEAWAYYYKAVPRDLSEALKNSNHWAPTSFEGDLSL